MTGEEVLRLGHGATGITIDELALLGDDLDQLCRMGLLSEQGINVGRSFTNSAWPSFRCEAAILAQLRD